MRIEEVEAGQLIYWVSWATQRIRQSIVVDVNKALDRVSIESLSKERGRVVVSSAQIYRSRQEAEVARAAALPPTGGRVPRSTPPASDPRSVSSGGIGK